MLLLINCYCIEFEVEIVCRYLEVEVYFFCMDQILVNFYVQNLGFLGFRGILLCFKRLWLGLFLYCFNLFQMDVFELLYDIGNY